MDYEQVMKTLKSKADPDSVKGMARFGINPDKTLGVSMPEVRRIAKRVGGNRELAEKLWSSGVHEAKILAGLVDEPGLVTELQMEEWVKDFDSWDVCDQVCMNLFDKTPFAYEKALQWSQRKEEFVKRAGFALMASLALHDKKAEDAKFEQFFPAIKKQAVDDRNYVKKSVNWALRQIGKRNLMLNKKAVKVAREIKKMNSKSADWIASDAIRELTSKEVLERLACKA
jgi:3-methyladenine DNA glycosylase AlkD